jgi:hypothetical protein
MDTQDTTVEITPAPKKKMPLWKQILGAVAGAGFAFVAYQSYAFTAPRLQALVTLPSGAPVDATKPLRTDPMNTNYRSSMSSSWSSSSEEAVFAPAMGAMAAMSSQPAVEPMLDPNITTMQESSSSETWQPEAQMFDEQSSESSSEEFNDIMAAEAESSSSEEPPVPPLYEPTPPLMATMTEHASHLPQSGFGLELVGITALGAALGRRATRRKKSA